MKKKFGNVFLAFALAFGMLVLPANQAQATEETDKLIQPINLTEYYSAEEIQEQYENGGIVNVVKQNKVTADFENAKKSSAWLLRADNLPSKVDLRDRGIITSVKNQSPFGDCWSFGSTAAAESSLATTSSAAKGVSFATKPIAWFAYTPLDSNASNLSGTAKKHAGEGSYIKSQYSSTHRMDVGGNSQMTAGLYAQGAGPAKLSEFPYQTSTGTYSQSDDWSVANSQRFTSTAKMRNFYVLPTTNSSSSGYTFSEEGLTAIKKEINAGRAVEMSYRADQSSPGGSSDGTYINRTTWAQYTDQKLQSNHSVCVVGYDDNYATSNFNADHRPAKPGAFIVKNSWGGNASTGHDKVSWGLNGTGYFYLSYYDQSIDGASSFVFDSNAYTGNNIDTSKQIIEQYDYVIPNNYSGSSYVPIKSWPFANTFSASENETIDSISAWTPKAGLTVKYRVYRGEPNASTVAQKDLFDEGTFTADYQGYYRIDLKSGISVNKGEKFTVEFNMDDGVYAYQPNSAILGPANGGYSTANTVVNAGESASFLNGTWTDLSTKKAQTDGGQWLTDNFSIKAYCTVKNGDTPTPAAKYTVTFNTDGGSSVESQTVESGKTATKPATNPTKSGYTFKGWFSDAACTKTFDFNTAITNNTTIYAGWTKNSDPTPDPTPGTKYIVLFNTNGGSSVASQTVASGAKAARPAVDPTKSGYTFKGWFSDSACTTAFDFNTAITKNITIYAGWTKNSGPTAVRNVKVIKTGTGTGSVVQTKLANNKVKVSWSSTTTKTNINMVTSVTVDGQSKYSSSNINKSSWQVANSEYKRRMKEDVKMTDFNKVIATAKSGGSVTVDTTPTDKDTSSDIEVVIKFEELVPVYRLYNMITSEHLFTTDKGEYDNWVAICKKNADAWIGEGIDWFSPKSGSNVYRLYNPGLGALQRTSHYYTNDTAEVKRLTSKYGWQIEKQFGGGSGAVFQSGGSAPVFTCYNEALRSAHHYTSNKTEYDGLKKHGWDLEKSKNYNSKTKKWTGMFSCMMSAK